MTVELKREQEAIIQEQLATGLYQSADEVVATALARLPHNLRSNQDAVARMIEFSRKNSIRLLPGESIECLIEEGHRY